jgi:hypothetical protein
MHTMKKILLCTLLAIAAHAAGAADTTAQEQTALTAMRQSYVKQTGHVPSAAEERAMLEMLRNASRTAAAMAGMAAMANGGGDMPHMAPQQRALPAQQGNSGAITEQALERSLAAMGGAKTRVRIEGARDGLRIDGESFLDPEGQIGGYAFDVLTGDITYTIRTGDGVVFKYLRAGSNADAVTLATAQQLQTGWQVTTVTGKTFSGDAVTPLAKGFMVSRSGSVFRYEPGKSSKGTAVPAGWVMAQFQRGNVGATRFILLEREQPAPGQSAGGLGALGSIFDQGKALIATAGLGKKEDYALMNLDTGKLYPLNIQVDGKIYTFMSNCRKRSFFVSQCATANSVESLYTADNDRNYSHYFWKANWYATPTGPIAVTLENGVADVYVLDLESGKKANAFHRGLGLSKFDSGQAPDGSVAIQANLAFDHQQIADAGKFLKESADVAVAGGAQ